MKLKFHFEKMDMDDQIIAVPCGDEASKFHGVIRLNETAAYILDMLTQDITEEEIVSAVLENYDGDEKEIQNYVHGFLDVLIKEDLLIK